MLKKLNDITINSAEWFSISSVFLWFMALLMLLGKNWAGVLFYISAGGLMTPRYVQNIGPWIKVEKVTFIYRALITIGLFFIGQISWVATPGVLREGNSPEPTQQVSAPAPVATLAPTPTPVPTTTPTPKSVATVKPTDAPPVKKRIKDLPERTSTEWLIADNESKEGAILGAFGLFSLDTERFQGFEPIKEKADYAAKQKEMIACMDEMAAGIDKDGKQVSIILLASGCAAHLQLISGFQL